MRLRTLLTAAAWTALLASSALAQAPTPPPAPPESPPSSEDTEGGPTVGESRVGYIDSAIPGSQFRLRYDAVYDDRRPNRAEFIWPQPGQGPLRPERRLDWQDVSGYLEVAPSERLSGFIEVPWRFLNPEVNANTEGIGDMNAGFKAAFLRDPDRVATFQLRTYIPTGAGTHGLGNGHVSLEPALLVFQRLTDRLNLEAELRDWVPLTDDAFAGNILRYGVGVDYDLVQVGAVHLSPVAEFVGWSILSGKESGVSPTGLVSVHDADGETIVNVKLGLRASLGRLGDLYGGYGRPLTGTRWYENTFRLEWRLLF
jgi:hypothetical protein